MKNKFFYIKYILYVLPFFVVLGQSSTDQLAKIRQLNNQGAYKQASSMLQVWTKANPPNVDVLWMYAQIEYKQKHYQNARRLYQKAISLAPQNLYLKLDYAENLLNMRQFSGAGTLLENLNAQERQDPYALFVRGKWHYWTGDIKKAHQEVTLAQKAGYQHGAALSREIGLARKPWLNANLEYGIDSQPIEYIHLSTSAGIFHAKGLDFKVEYIPSRFLSNGILKNVVQLNLQNRFHFPKIGAQIALRIGSSQLQQQPTVVTGGVEWQQRLSSRLGFRLDYNKQPYVYTQKSLDSNVVFRHFSPVLEWQGYRGLWINIGGQVDRFEDDNQVTTFWTWTLLPPLKRNNIALQLGYAYSFADAKYSRYLPEKSATEIFQNPNEPIKGVYVPYFTPERMSNHTGIGIVNYEFAKRSFITLTTKYGFVASAQSPFFALKTQNGKTILVRDFTEVQFSPFEAGLKLSAQVTDRLSAQAHYTWFRNFFYDVQTSGLNFQYRF